MNSYLKSLYIFILLGFGTQVVRAQDSHKDLDFFLREAVRSSPILQDFRNQGRSAGIDSLMIKASGKPQVTASSAGLYAPVIKSYGYDEVLTNGQSLEALLNVNYDLMSRKRINNQLEGVKIQSDSIRYAGQLSFLDLKRSITDQYITAYSSQQQLDFNKELINLLKKEEMLLKQLTRNNIYKQSEYLTFLVTLQQQQLVLMQSELQLSNDYATLNYLSGISDTTHSRLLEPTLDMPPSLSEKSFFTKRFDLDSLKNINQRKALELNYKPKLGVYANGGYNSSFSLQPYRNFGTSIGFSFSVPIYDGHQKKMQTDKLDLLANTSSGYRAFFSRQQKKQINLIVQQITQTNLLFSQINEQIRFSKGLIEADSRLLHTGDLRVADFVIAINNYMSAQNLLRQTHISRLKLINQFKYWNK